MRAWTREISGKVLAVAVLLLCAFVLFKLVLGFVTFLAWVAVAIVAVFAALWALNRVL
ncbi:MAG TPA: hypothetical protein VIM03_08370 [Thermoleophilaceae bacterium]|jgi:hypothetical protein